MYFFTSYVFFGLVFCQSAFRFIGPSFYDFQCTKANHWNFLFFFFKILFIYLERQGGRKRERTIDVWEIHRSGASPHPRPGTWPPAQACTLPGNQTGDLSIFRPVLNPRSPTGQGKFSFHILNWNFNSGISTWFPFKVFIVIIFHRFILHHHFL